jgi:hypothetical protein
MTVALRDIDNDWLAGGQAMGRDVLRALGFDAGFTHMEWYRKDDGEVVFGEIGARPPGARTVDVMNYATDGDLFRMWAEAVVSGTSTPLIHRYNAPSIFKRAEGSGHISPVAEGPAGEYRENVCVLDLCRSGRIGATGEQHISDGMVLVRDTEMDSLIELADRFARDRRMYGA